MCRGIHVPCHRRHTQVATYSSNASRVEWKGSNPTCRFVPWIALSKNMQFWLGYSDLTVTSLESLVSTCEGNHPQMVETCMHLIWYVYIYICTQHYTPKLSFKCDHDDKPHDWAVPYFQTKPGQASYFLHICLYVYAHMSLVDDSGFQPFSPCFTTSRHRQSDTYEMPHAPMVQPEHHCGGGFIWRPLRWCSYQAIPVRITNLMNGYER